GRRHPSQPRAHRLRLGRARGLPGLRGDGRHRRGHSLPRDLAEALPARGETAAGRQRVAMTVELGHETMGSGEPLVMLHGLFGSRRNWLSIIRPLSEDLQVVAVDLRNHGSSGHAATMSFAEMADDVAALADRLGLDRVNVAGHSLGGKVAMLFALRHPSRTRRLLVLDVAPVPYRGPFGRYIDAMLAMPLAQMRTRQEAEEALAPAVPQAAVRQFLLHNLVRDG